MNSVVTCGDNLEAVRDWIKLRDGELESVGPVGADLKSAMEQKEKLKVKENLKVMRSRDFHSMNFCSKLVQRLLYSTRH